MADGFVGTGEGKKEIGKLGMVRRVSRLGMLCRVGGVYMLGSLGGLSIG